MAYRIDPVAHTDAPGLAETLMRIMNHDLYCSLLLNNVTTEQLITDTSLRRFHNLARDCDSLCHQKVAHTTTGIIADYARWKLSATDGSKSVWLDVKITAPTLTQQNAFKDGFNLMHLS